MMMMMMIIIIIINIVPLTDTPLLLFSRSLFPLYRVEKAQRESTGSALFFSNFGTRWSGRSTPRSGHFTSKTEPRFPLYRRPD